MKMPSIFNTFLYRSNILSAGVGSPHNRCPGERDGVSCGRHWFRHGCRGRAEVEAWCHGSCAHIRSLLPHCCSHHPLGSHFLLCGRQHGEPKIFTPLSVPNWTQWKKSMF